MRQTAHRVASAHSAVLSGGVPEPDLASRVPHPVLARTWIPPCLGLGYTPPKRDLGPVTGVPPERTWDQWKYCGMEMGYPTGVDR